MNQTVFSLPSKAPLFSYTIYTIYNLRPILIPLKGAWGEGGIDLKTPQSMEYQGRIRDLLFKDCGIDF